MQNKSRILSGVFTLFAAGLIVKILGLIFKIPLQHLIGDTGMGYFNVAYNIYAWFYIISTAGLPVSVSISIARANAAGDKTRCFVVFRCAVLLFSAVGLLCSLFMALFSGPLSFASSVSDSRYCIAAIAPSVFFGCISSAVRGYYQGFGIMWPSAVSQVIESSGKLVFGLVFAFISVSRGSAPYVVAAYTIFGVTCGSALSALFCLTVKLLYKRIKPDNSVFVPKKSVINELIKTAVPVTVSSAVMNLTGMIDVFAAPSRLIKIGYSESQATEIFGNYTTLAVPMINLPMIFVYPVTSAALPALSANYYSKRDTRKSVEILKSVYKTVLTVALPCAVGLSVMAKPMLALIFSENSAALAAPMLTVLAPASALCALLAVTDTLLSAKGKAHFTIISMLAGSAVKFISTSLLIFMIGRIAVPLGTCLCYLTAVTLNFVFSYEKTASFRFGSFIKLAFSCALCGLCAYYTYELLCFRFSSDISCILSVPAAAVVYFLTLFMLGYIDTDQLNNIIRKIKKKELTNDRI